MGATSSLLEYAFGFRGAAILVLFFSVLINIELTYSGQIRNRQHGDNNNHDGAGRRASVDLQVAPPQTVPTTNTQNEQTEDVDVEHSDARMDGDEQEENVEDVVEVR